MSALSRYKVQILGASVDTPDANQKFAKDHGFNFVLLSDPDHKLVSALGVLSEHNYANRWHFIIDDKGIIRDIVQNVSPPTAGKDLARRLEELKVPKRG